MKEKEEETEKQKNTHRHQFSIVSGHVPKGSGCFLSALRKRYNQRRGNQLRETTYFAIFADTKIPASLYSSWSVLLSSFAGDISVSGRAEQSQESAFTPQSSACVLLPRWLFSRLSNCFLDFSQPLVFIALSSRTLPPEGAPSVLPRTLISGHTFRNIALTRVNPPAIRRHERRELTIRLSH